MRRTGMSILWGHSLRKGKESLHASLWETAFFLNMNMLCTALCCQAHVPTTLLPALNKQPMLVPSRPHNPLPDNGTINCFCNILYCILHVYLALTPSNTRDPLPSHRNCTRNSFQNKLCI